MEGFNRQTIISFPNRSDISDLSTGIISGTLSIEEILCEKNIEFGAFNASKFEVQLYDFGDISNEAIEVYQLDNGIKKAIFTGIVDSCKKDSNGYYRDIVAYDSVYKKRDINIATWWNEFWKNKTTTNLKELRTSLLNYMQITYVNKDLFNDNLTFEKPADFDSIPFGTILQAICQLQLCFPHVNRIGSLEFITLATNKDEAITISESEFEKGNTTFEAYSTHVITRVQIYNGSNELVGLAGLEGNNYTISDNLFITAFNTEEVNTIAGSMLNQLKAISLTPVEVTMLQSNLDFKLGDYVKVGNVYSYIMINSMSGIQLVEQTLKADADEYFSETTAYDANIQYYKDKINQVAHIMETDYLKTSVADIKYLSVDKQSVIEANIKEAVIQEADIKYATIENEKVINSKIDNLEVRYAEVITLNADVANIKTLMFGSASGGSLTTEFSNSVVSLIGDAQIKSAMIESIAADKITSGKIYTNLVEILSESGNLDITDNTIQIKDDNKVTRVQIGKDANSDYNMYVWDKSGNLMFDALGLTEKGVTRKVVRDDIVQDNANINASKLDIESLFNVINEDGSHTLKSSKIYVDANKQTLDVAFKSMTTNVTNLQNTVTTQGTQLTAVQGQLSSKVWQQDITTAVNNLQIGGRNLLLNTAGNNSFEHWDAYRVSNPVIVKDTERVSGNALKFTSTGGGLYQRKGGKADDSGGTYAAGTTITISGYIKSNKAKATLAVSCEGGGDGTTKVVSTPLENTWYYFSFTTTPSKNWATMTFYGENGVDYYLGDLKLEYGEKATTWTPAPEDIDSDISAVDTKVTTVSNQYTSLNQSLTSLTATVNSNTTKINEKADGSTVTALQANITSLTADLSGFKTTVSQTYTSKTEFNGLQIGGRNLYLGTKDFSGNWINLSQWKVESEKYEGLTVVSTFLTWNGVGKPQDVACKAGDIFTYSLYAKTSGEDTQAVVTCPEQTNFEAIYVTASSEWKRYTFVIQATTDGYMSPRISKTESNYVSLFICGIKLEKGNKATDWSPAPEDTDEKFTDYSTTTQMNSAITQSASSILNTVSSNYATKASLEVKIDKDKLISEINASADIITLKSNRFVLDSTNAKISADGTVNFTGGTIGGWNISPTKLSGSAGLYGISLNKPTSTSTKVININHIDTTAAATYVDDFYVRADGYTYIPDGYLSTKNHSVGGKGIEIHEGNIDFYDWTKKDNFIGSILAGVIGKDSSDARGAIAILCDDGDRVQIGRRRGVSATSYDSAITINGDDELGIEFYGNVKGYGQKGACFHVNSAGLTNFAITNQENTIYGNCELSVYGTQRLKYELYVEGNIHGNVISASDKNVKKDIQALDIEDSAQFIYSLVPSEFRFKNGTSNRLHHGLIAQEVKKSMGDNDWGLFIDKKVDNENYIETEVNSKTGEQTQLLTARYGLRYDELIADLIATVQSLNNRLKVLEK